MNDKEVLRWCGLMGHPFVIVIDDAKEGRRCLGEVNDEATAIKWAKEGPNGAAYRKDAKRGWRLLAKFPTESAAA